MELVVVNGANAISRGVVSKLAGKQYQKIRLLDFRPYRKSVYDFQRQLPQGVELNKHMVSNAAALEHQLDGASDVLYFTHDYCANAADKNSFIQGTAKLAKKHGVNKLVAVCPVEHELYYTEDDKLPLQKQAEAQQLALQSNPNLTILNSNLVYGRHSHLIHFMTQCAAAGKINASVGGNKTYHFKPVSTDDLALAVQTALTNFSDVKGQNYLVNGEHEHTLNEILHLVESAVGKGAGQTSLSKSFLRLNLSDFVEEFFTGISHDKNFRNFADYFDTHKPNLLEGRTDFFQKHGLKHSKDLTDTYKGANIHEEDLVFPIFSNYKMTSLD